MRKKERKDLLERREKSNFPFFLCGGKSGWRRRRQNISLQGSQEKSQEYVGLGVGLGVDVVESKCGCG